MSSKSTLRRQTDVSSAKGVVASGSEIKTSVDPRQLVLELYKERTNLKKKYESLLAENSRLREEEKKLDHRLELLCKQADEARKMEEVFRLRCQQAAKEETQSTQEVQKLQAKLTRRQEKCADLERQKLAALELFEDSVKQETDRLFEMFTKFNELVIAEKMPNLHKEQREWAEKIAKLGKKLEVLQTEHAELQTNAERRRAVDPLDIETKKCLLQAVREERRAAVQALAAQQTKLRDMEQKLLLNKATAKCSL